MVGCFYDIISRKSKKELEMIKTITTMLLGAVVLLGAEGAGFDIDKAKKRATENIDREIKILENAKGCVAGAKTKAELQACREKAMIDLQAAKADRAGGKEPR